MAVGLGGLSIPISLVNRMLAVIMCYGLVVAPSLAQIIPPLDALTPASDPVWSELETNRAIFDFERGQYDEVLRRLKPIGIDESPSATYYRGLSLLSLKKAREALTQFEAVQRQSNAPAEVELDSAVAYLSLGDAKKAEEVLRFYLKSHPDDPYAHFFLGVSHFRQKKFDEAIAELNRTVSDAKLSQYLDFYKGLSSYAKGESGFKGYLENFRKSGGTSGASGDLTQQLLSTSGGPTFRPGQSSGKNATGPNGVKGPNPDRRWNLAILSGYEYDTNVALVPGLSFTPVGLGAGRNPKDSRWNLASFGEYRLIQKEKIVLGLIGSTYDTYQFKLDRYNFQDYMGGIYSNVAIGDRWILGSRYEFHEDLLGGKQFATDHRLTPNLTFREGTLGHTTAYYEFEAIDLTGLPILVPAQNRSGTTNSVGVTQAFYLMNGAGRLFLGYRYDRANTVGLDYDRRTNQLDARLELPLPGKMVANIEGRYFFNDYLHPNSLDFFGRNRNDQTVEARAGVQKFFTRNLSLRVEYVYTSNNSNVQSLFGSSPFSYNRSVLSSMLIYDF